MYLPVVEAERRAYTQGGELRSTASLADPWPGGYRYVAAGDFNQLSDPAEAVTKAARWDQWPLLEHELRPLVDAQPRQPGTEAYTHVSRNRLGPGKHTYARLDSVFADAETTAQWDEHLRLHQRVSHDWLRACLPP